MLLWSFQKWPSGFFGWQKRFEVDKRFWCLAVSITWYRKRPHHEIVDIHQNSKNKKKFWFLPFFTHSPLLSLSLCLGTPLSFFFRCCASLQTSATALFFCNSLLQLKIIFSSVLYLGRLKNRVFFGFFCLPSPTRCVALHVQIFFFQQFILYSVLVGHIYFFRSLQLSTFFFFFQLNILSLTKNQM